MTAKTFSSRSFCGSSDARPRRRLLRASHALLATILIAGGCATNGPPEVGSRGWHEQRIAEIDAAHANDELTTEQYLSLKNEADATRAKYRASLQQPRYYGPMYPSPFFHGHVHHHH